MKVLVCQPGPDFSVQDVSAGWVAGLRQAGVHVVDFNLADRLVFYCAAHVERDGQWVQAFDYEAAVQVAMTGLEAACYEYAPDVVVVISGFFVPPGMYRLMRARGAHVVLLCTESPYEDGHQYDLAGLVDTVIVNDPTNLDQFRKINRRCWYIGHGYDPNLHRPGPPTPAAASDFAFVGTGWPSRIEFFEHVGWDGIDVALAGHWAGLTPDSPLRKYLAHDIDTGCPNDQAVTLYQSTKASANLYRRETSEGGTAAGWACGPREIELAAAGCFFLSEPRGENRELFPMVPTFDSPEDFEEQLRWYLDRDDLRADIAAAARTAVADRSFHSNARRLLELLDA